MNTNLQHQLIGIFKEFIREEIIVLLNEKSNQSQSQYIKSEKQDIDINPIGWLKNESTLLKLYSLLISCAFISCEFEIFKSHFWGTTGVKGNIIWLTDIKQLVYLFNQFQEEKFIPNHNNPHKILRNHFIDKYGNQLKIGSLRSSLNTVRNNKRIKIIESIIEELKKAQ